MPENNETRVLIVVFDALRPEFVTPDLMPNLHGFAARGVRYPNSRSTFPTETRVNQSAVITGCYPGKHGIVANKFPEPEAAPGEVLNTGDDVELEAAFARLNGRLLDVPTLGERLAGHGLRYATISAGTPGGGRLINHAAEAHGGFRLAMRRPEAAMPHGVMAGIEARIGPLPALELPALDWISYAVDCYLDYVEPEITPHAMLLWLCEPDESFHILGIGSPDTLRAMRHVDAEFGRILAAHEKAIEAGCLQVVALSDHGQIGLEGEPLDLIARFNDAGFAAATGPGRDADCALVVGNAGGLWVRDGDQELTGRIVEWLRAQSWCGPLFTRDGIGGTLALREVGLGHRRAPDIGLALRYGDDENDWGLKGLTLHDSRYPAGGGCHGGLSPYELNNVLAMAGSAFKERQIIEAPAGNVDIAPTVLALLGVDVPDGIDGRVLRESLREGAGDPAEEPVVRTLTSSNGSGPVTHLSVTELGASRYLNRAWVE